MILTSATRRYLAASLVAALLLILSIAAHAASYRVYPLPVGSPDHGSRVLAVDPHDPVASPFGWHDDNGVDGAEYTSLRGNNAWVYLDADNNSVPDGPGPDGGASLVFDHPAAPGSAAPLTYADALATNAFYLGNMMHDILYHHGFREEDGNFQDNNYGAGGLGNDGMRIEIFNGSSLGQYNNALWQHTADGVRPRIELFVWNLTNPHREPSFDAGVVAYTYMILVVGRLTTTSCLGNADNPISGYADWFGTLVTNNFASTTPTTPRGMATWLIGQPVNGTGIRTHPYTTDMAVNPLTYVNSITNSPSAVPLGIGTIFASALWDLTWRLVQRDGASGNLFSGSGGENRALSLVIQALKSQACNPGMVDARDALLLADTQLSGGMYQCEIWRSFARRGLGLSASQGLSSSNLDNVPAFDTPESCDLLFEDGFEP